MRRLALVASTLTVACASGGGSAPALTPAETEALYARYSGSWDLSEEYSDAGSDALETEVSSARPGDPKDRPELSGRTIRPVYQREGTTRRAIAQQMDRAAMRQAILMAGKRPDRVRLKLSAAGLEVTFDDREAWVLPADGSRIEVAEDLGPVGVRLVWEQGIPIIEREISKAGVIRETLEAAADGRTLWITRQVVMGKEGWQPAQFTFVR